MPQVGPIGVVIVDDNSELRSLLSEILTETGYSVRTSSDGFAALAAIRDKAPAVLITDLNMPGMSGFELIPLVRRQFADIAIIAMSGSYSARDLPQGISVDAFYEKGCGSIVPLQTMVRIATEDQWASGEWAQLQSVSPSPFCERPEGAHLAPGTELVRATP